ncbi:unnamed protein product, partial [Rangifer tarandus platyrhynchus]
YPQKEKYSRDQRHLYETKCTPALQCDGGEPTTAPYLPPQFACRATPAPQMLLLPAPIAPITLDVRYRGNSLSSTMQQQGRHASRRPVSSSHRGGTSTRSSNSTAILDPLDSSSSSNPSKTYISSTRNNRSIYDTSPAA